MIDGAALRIDDRLRVAKERREEADKQQGKRADPPLSAREEPSQATSLLFIYLILFSLRVFVVIFIKYIIKS